MLLPLLLPQNSRRLLLHLRQLPLLLLLLQPMTHDCRMLQRLQRLRLIHSPMLQLLLLLHLLLLLRLPMHLLLQRLPMHLLLLPRLRHH